ncbi:MULTISPECIES: hypothetical protein [Peribacillus]|uniref:hypothetical protein n=1 Tax=Peribacillus TaxID=2675229 RepID=UPI001F4E7DC3|nr:MULTISPECIES: hypothetical protein [unclassified Peribacillus]MCK1982239.1 hypothetical protein [Peribacillus sp. Aquil_B1]MCK2007409.1 hypothetical protein [Peribacillus sp. Aquil_B8]
MTTIQIVEHSGKTHLTEVENYSAADTFQQMQNALNSNYMILIGSVVIDARSINTITEVLPTEETTA